MSLNFTVKEFILGNGTGTPAFQFYKKGFLLNGGSVSPSYVDIILSGVGSVTLVNAKANSLNYLKLFGGCEQNGTPTPTTPIDIVCNNGVLKARHQSGLPLGYTRLSYINSTHGIELNNKTTDNSEIEAGFTRTSNNAQYVYQSDTDSAGTTNTTAYIPNTQAGNWRFGGNAVRVVVNNFTNNQYVTTIQNKNGVYKDGVLIEAYSNINTFTSINNLVALGFNANAPINLDYLIQRENGVIIGKYLACKNSLNVFGLYDVIGGAFYTNNEATITGGEVVSDPIEIYTDGTVETVEVTSQNLFNLAGQTLDKYYDSSGVEQSGIYSGYKFAHTDFLKVEPNTTYTFSAFNVLPDKLSNHRIMGWDSSKTFIQQEGNLAIPNNLPKGTRRSTTFTTGSTTEYITINYVYNPYGESPQLELGETMTDYTPYYYGGSATAEMLLKVGTYKDVQSVLDGAITRNVGVKVLDGTEEFKTSNAYGQALYIQSAITKWNANKDLNICNYFKGLPMLGSAGEATAENTCFFNISGHFYFRTTKTNTEFKQWLTDKYNAGTPVMVVYPTSSATTETVTAQPLTIQTGTNIVEITQASIDNLELEVKYKATA